MPNLLIERSIDIEEVVRSALAPYFTAYVRPLPAKLKTPSIEIQKVGGTDANEIDTFDIVIDSRAKEEAEAELQLRNAIGALKAIAANQTTELRYVKVNSSGSWGSDPVRPDLAMSSARLRVVAHQEKTIIGGKST